MSKQIAVIGLGYVGLPLLLAFAKKFPGTIGFDIDLNKVELLQQGIDPNGGKLIEDFNTTVVKITGEPTDLASANFFIVTAPTPIDQNHRPDLNPLISASQIIKSC